MHQSPFLPTPSRACDAILVELVEPLVRVERGVGRRVGGAHAERAVARLDGQPRALLDAHATFDAGNDAGRVVALAVIAHHAAEHLVHRQLQRLALDVPQRQIERADAHRPFRGPAG